MAARLNELKQRVLDGKASLNALLGAEATTKSALADLLRAEKQDPEAIEKARATAKDSGHKLAAAREALQADEEALHAEEQRVETLNATATRIVVGKDRATEQPWHSEADGPEEQAKMAGLGRWAQAVAAACSSKGWDPRLGDPRNGYKAAAAGMSETSGESAGFAVPVEYAPGIERDMFETGQVLSRVDVRTIAGNAITYTLLNETDRRDGTRQGGILGYWLDEAGEPTISNTKLARIEMKLRKVGALGVMTDELLEDAPALGQELQAMFSEELTFQTENKIFRGAGVGAPLGFLNAPCLVTVAIEGGQTLANGAILPVNLSKMWARLPARSQANAAWFVNVEAQPALDLMSIAAGTAALEPRFVNYGPTGILTIKGRPVIPVEYCSALGTVGDIVLADMAKYRLIRKASGVQQASSIHVYFVSAQQAFRAIYRVDGQPVPRAALTPFLGSSTLSPFVVLDTRA